MSYEVKLDIFEGPLDLLLYLIRKNELDIYNIPMALITEQYLAHLEMMKALNLDLAGEYLVLAATLVHIKSRMLLPVEEGEKEGEDETDPRAELVRQLLEYQAFKEVALSLERRNLLDRDVFKRIQAAEETADEQEDPMVEVTLFELIEAFKQVAERMDKEDLLEIDTETDLALRPDQRDPGGSIAGEESVLHGPAEDKPHQEGDHLHAPGHSRAHEDEGRQGFPGRSVRADPNFPGSGGINRWMM